MIDSLPGCLRWFILETDRPALNQPFWLHTLSTFLHIPSSSSQVMSSHSEALLPFWCHTVEASPCGARPILCTTIWYRGNWKNSEEPSILTDPAGTVQPLLFNWMLWCGVWYLCVWTLVFVGRASDSNSSCRLRMFDVQVEVHCLHGIPMLLNLLPCAAVM